MARRSVETSSRTEKIRAVRISKSMESLHFCRPRARARARTLSPRGFHFCHFFHEDTMPSTFPRVLIFADSSRSCRWLYGSSVHTIVRTGTSRGIYEYITGLIIVQE